MNILIMTIFYPDNLSYSISQTKAIHYLAKNLTDNNRIVVMHNRVVNSALIRVLKHEKRPDEYLSSYEIIDGVEVIRNTVVNITPKYCTLFPHSVNKETLKTLGILNSHGFSPDVIVAHFCWQQRDIINSLRKSINVPIIPVFHNIDVKHRKYCMKMVHKYPLAGARSLRIQNELVQCGYQARNLFIVNSGYPPFDQTDIETKEKSIGGKKKTFIFAGNLIKIKRVDDVIRAMGLLKDKYEFSFTVIGDGVEKENLISLSKQVGLNDRIVFWGRLSREDTIVQMKHSDCFIMTSSPETFGISYIEAMACKCFIIGSKGEGIDGVIVSGENGLLAVPGDINSIKESLETYLSMETPDMIKIVNEGYQTSKKFTEKAVAKDYLDSLSLMLKRSNDHLMAGGD